MVLTKLDSAEMRKRIERHHHWVAMGELETDPIERLVLLEKSVSPIHAEDETFSSAQIVRCDLSESTFTRCDFRSALLIESTFRNCKFLSCQFRKAELSSANCIGAHFLESDMTRADLSHANMMNANLTNSDMSWCWLLDTDLRFAVLENINLEGARLVGTKVYNTRRFLLRGIERAVIENVLVDRDAEGPPLSGSGSLEFLRGE
jgi:uncharacterized protein YjbI with pentapeptide repeats